MVDSRGKYMKTLDGLLFRASNSTLVSLTLEKSKAEHGIGEKKTSYSAKNEVFRKLRFTLSWIFRRVATALFP